MSARLYSLAGKRQLWAVAGMRVVIAALPHGQLVTEGFKSGAGQVKPL